jgi:hypothetical protein
LLIVICVCAYGPVYWTATLQNENIQILPQPLKCWENIRVPFIEIVYVEDLSHSSRCQYPRIDFGVCLLPELAVGMGSSRLRPISSL